jgi:tetratricopeptide (TPR) repeat protein
MLHTVHGNFGRALKDVQNSLRIASEIGHREYVVGARFALGVLYSELFAPDQARGQLEEALTLARDLRSAAWIHPVSGALARAHLLLGDLKSAQGCLETVISAETPMDTLGKCYCWVRRAELALLQDDPTLALDIVDRLIASAPGMAPGRVITFLWQLKAEALAAIGRAEDAGAKDAGAKDARIEHALSLLHEAIENAGGNGERFLLWRVQASLGRLHRAMGQQEAAEKEFSAARALIDELAATIPDETLKDRFHQGAYRTLRKPL